MIDFANDCNTILKEVNNLVNECLDKFYVLKVLEIEKSKICNSDAFEPESISLFNKNRFRPDEIKRILSNCELNLIWCENVCTIWLKIHENDWDMSELFKEEVLKLEEKRKKIEIDYEDNWRYIAENEEAIERIILKIKTKITDVKNLINETKKFFNNNPINEIDYSKELNKWIALINQCIQKYNEVNENKLMQFNFYATKSDKNQIQVMATIYAMLSSFKNWIQINQFIPSDYYKLKVISIENRQNDGIELKTKIDSLIKMIAEIK